MKQSLDIGTTLGGGRYIIEKVLGIGGFGITYYARHKELDCHYAIKEFFINGKCMREGDHNTVSLQEMDPLMYNKLKTRFADEARTLAALNHPHVVRVNDIFDENNTSYIVMEYVEGTTLQQLVERNGKMSYDDAVNCMGQLGEAVAYIHSKHVLHRDIKPDNIIVTPDNRIVLIDFGSAREFVHDEVQRHTTILTLGYAPIEQYTSTSKKGNYTDIYAMGGVFYFLLTGQRPMDVTTRTMERMPSPHELDPNISLDVSQTIMKAMEFKPEDRYQSVDAFMADLLGETSYTPSVQQAQTRVVSEPTKVAEPVVSTDSEEKKSNSGLVAGIIAGAVALIVIILLITRNKDDRNISQQPTYYNTEQSQSSQSYESSYQSQQTTSTETTYQSHYDRLLNMDLGSRYLNKSDLSGLTSRELTYLRNSIYAKHGYVFKSDELDRYFSQFSWYHRDYSVTDDILNSTERANTKLIREYQKEYGMEYKPD